MQYPSEDEFVAQTETELRQRVDELWSQRDVPYQFFVVLQPERRLGEPGHYFGIRRICATLSITGMYGFAQESAWLEELKTCIGIVEARGDTLCLSVTPGLSQK